MNKYVFTCVVMLFAANAKAGYVQYPGLVCHPPYFSDSWDSGSWNTFRYKRASITGVGHILICPLVMPSEAVRADTIQRADVLFDADPSTTTSGRLCVGEHNPSSAFGATTWCGTTGYMGGSGHILSLTKPTVTINSNWYAFVRLGVPSLGAISGYRVYDF